ncbi:MAG TPA: autotransporter assembly complex family protein [Gammaproteobacteria bacterium]|nr:autotransporter assembly complex family protein [Gammaproteobacteria bacterium]
MVRTRIKRALHYHERPNTSTFDTLRINMPCRRSDYPLLAAGHSCGARRKLSGMDWRRLSLVACMLASGPVWALAGVTVEINGVHGELADNVRAFLSIVAHGEKGEAQVSVRTVQRLHLQATDEIRQALQPFGYYSPRIRATLKRTEDGWRARYRIAPGPPTIVRRAVVRVDGGGQDEPAVRAALASVEIKRGTRLQHSQYDAAKKALYDAAYNAGYLNTHYQRSELLVKPEQRRAEIYLILKTGQKYYFGPVTIEQGILKPEFVQRFVQFEPGEPFDTDALLNLQLALNDSGYFDLVELRVNKDKAKNRRVPVKVITEPSRPRRYIVGLGYGTDTGPRLSLGIELRRINRRGHRFRADLRLSTIRNALSAQYLIPIKNVAADSVAFAATLQQEQIGDADTEQAIFGISRNEGWLGFRRSLYFNYHREYYDFGAGPRRRADLLFPGITLTRNRADDPLYARHGSSISLDLHGGDQNLFSDTSFLRTAADIRWVFPLGKRSRLLLHTEGGAVLAETFSELPPSQRFYTGGDRTVRGYGYQDIAPHNSAGDAIGGRYLIAGGAEADWLFYGNFGAAVFFDAGAAFNGTPDLQRGAGVGLRYRSPIGMIRVDFAHAFDGPNNSFRVQLSIGPDL